MRRFGGRSGDERHIRDEQHGEHCGIEQPDLPPQQHREAVDGRERQREDLDGMAALEREHRPAHLQPEQAENQRPGEADQDAVGTGHVGDGIRRELRVPPRLPGEGHIHGVFGEYGDERNQREGQPLRDIHLGRLRRPAQEKSGRDDGQAVQGGVGHRAEARSRQSGVDARQGERHGQRDEAPLRPRLSRLPLLRHGMSQRRSRWRATSASAARLVVLPPIARQTYSRTHCGPDEPRHSSGRWGTRHHIVAIPLAAGLLAP